MSTSSYNYHPFHSIGAAKLLLWDPLALHGDGAWRSLGRVADVSVLVSGEQAEKGVSVRGVNQPIARRPRSRRYSLSLLLLEASGPEAQELLLSDGAVQSAQRADIAVHAERLRLYGTEQQELAHPYGIVSALPAGVSGLSASASGSGGVIAATNYHYWVVPYLAHGTARFLCTPVHTGPVTVGSGQQVTFTFTAPADYTPAGYRIYYASSNNIAASALAAESSSGAPIVISSHAGTPAYSAQEVPLIELLSYNGGSVFEAGADYSLDAQRGLLARASDGDIASGESLAAIYAVHTSAGVSSGLGQSIAPERYARIKLLQLLPEGPEQQGLSVSVSGLDPAGWRESGVEFEFYKVALSSPETRWPFAENDFGEGLSVLWDCMLDGETSAVGTVRSSYSVLAEWA